MKAGKTNKASSNLGNPAQAKAKNQAKEGPILQAYKQGTIQFATVKEEEKVLQGKFSGNVVQRDAYWPLNAQNQVTDPVPQNANPGGQFLKRVGNTNQRLYNKVVSAKNAAKKDSGWNGDGFSSRNPTAPPAGAGNYHYNQTVANNGAGVYTVNAGVPMVVKHDQDNQAVLSTHTNAQHNTIKHFHAATSNNNNILAPASQAAQPAYNQAGTIEHYLVNPL